MNTPNEILLKNFGYHNFRNGQEDVIESILSGRDVIAVMPTGGGKSICYQVPALLLPGITVVISPLISLMKDQVMSLKENGVPAAYINSSLSAIQIEKVFENIKFGKYKIIYIAPERLDTKRFLSILKYINISLVAVDEAHCISEWGQDFRPSYLKISEFIKMLPKKPIVSAFTATATELVQKDIVNALNLNNPFRIVTGFDRPNLYYDVVCPKNKSQKLLELLKKYDGNSGIIYCSTRKQVEKTYDFLIEHAFSVTKYHAGLPEDDRHNNQDDFVFDKCRIMVATNAFGMGIDKSNVSFVIHYNMPKSLEEYYQEAGRAGRDGTNADCILLFSGGDIQTAKFMIENSLENEELSVEEKMRHTDSEFIKLERMIGYCKTSNCYRGYILDYFGETHNEFCENCGNCSSDLIETDITIEAQKIMSCIKRVHSALGYYVGTALIIRVLRGSKDKRIMELSLNKLSTYGILNNLDRNTIQLIIDRLVEQQYLIIEKPYNILKTGINADKVLFEKQKVLMKSKEQKTDRNASGETSNSDFTGFVFEKLRNLRLKIAHMEGVPAFVVFSDATLLDMAEKLPQTPKQFMDVSGVGSVKTEKYADVFIKEIKKWVDENNG